MAISSRQQSKLARERLVREATRLFYQRGINAVGVDEIVARATVARMTLYNQFGSKDGLIAACLTEADTAYHEWFVNEVETRTSDPRERLRVVFDVLDGWFNSEQFRGCTFMNAAVELTDPVHPGHVPVLAHKRRTRAYLRELTAAAGLDAPDEAADTLMLLIEGATMTALVEGDMAAARKAGRAAEALLPGTTEERPPKRRGRRAA